MKNKKFLILVGVIVVLLLVLICIKINVGTDTVNTEEYSAEAENGVIVSGENEWQQFLSNTKTGYADKIVVKVSQGDSSYTATIKYSFGTYAYTDEVGNSYKNSTLLDVTGKWSGTGKEGRLIVLTDDDYTFEELTNSIVSSDSEELIDYQILFQ